MKKTFLILLIVVAVSGCTTDPYTGNSKISNTAIGAGTGAALGALGGLIVGSTTNANKRNAVLIGAGVGALTGGGVGHYQDKQEAKLELNNTEVLL